MFIPSDHFNTLRDLLQIVMKHPSTWESVKVAAFWGDHALQSYIRNITSADRLIQELVVYGHTINREDALLALVDELLYLYHDEKKSETVATLERIREDLVGQLA